jgi:hypothetical protein
MAEENARPTRGQKKTADGAAKRTAGGGRKKAAPKMKAAPKPKTAKPAATKATGRARKAAAIVPEPTREAIAEHAYLLWERGEPGDETDHWLRAEAELRAA